MLADKYNCTLGNLAIAWVAAQSKNMNVLTGARKIEQIKENAKAGDIVLDAADIAFMRDSIKL